jgi:hypothetical protein
MLTDKKGKWTSALQFWACQYACSQSYSLAEGKFVHHQLIFCLQCMLQIVIFHLSEKRWEGH